MHGRIPCAINRAFSAQNGKKHVSWGVAPGWDESGLWPTLATQQAIVAEIEAEQALVAANRELITRFEQKIQATLARIWGEEAPATTDEIVSLQNELEPLARVAETPALA